MHKRLIASLIFLSCAGNVTPNFYEYRDAHERTHIYQVNITTLPLSRENPTEYYYCIEHEKLEEIRLVFDTPVIEAEDDTPKFYNTAPLIHPIPITPNHPQPPTF